MKIDVEREWVIVENNEWVWSEKIIELLGKEEISGGENGCMGIKCIKYIKGEGRLWKREEVGEQWWVLENKLVIF